MRAFPQRDRRPRPRYPTCRVPHCRGAIVFYPDGSVACLLCGRVPGTSTYLPTPAQQLEAIRSADGRRAGKIGPRVFYTDRPL